jgi:predicted RNA-binding protein with PIN domain
MKPTYLIDAYNLLHAMGILQGRVTSLTLEKARITLLDFLANSFGEKSPFLTVVFDASRAPPTVQARQEYKGMQVLFALGPQEADDLIENLLNHHAHPKDVFVVSNDHRLQQAARRRHAHVLTCDGFLDVIDSQRLPSPPASSRPEKIENLSPEEKQKWLDEFRDLQKALDDQDPY